MVGPRRRSREVALQILHQIDVGGDLDAAPALRSYFAHLSTDGGPVADDEEPTDGLRADARIDRALVEQLVTGVQSHRAEIDDLLTELSRNWRLERMAVVERNVIRIALYELRYCPTVPINVVLNEAIELSKTYGTAEGTAFVNGLLERAVTELQIRR
jgi:transcription antitermination protein NusB